MASHVLFEVLCLQPAARKQGQKGKNPEFKHEGVRKNQEGLRSWHKILLKIQRKKKEAKGLFKGWKIRVRERLVLVKPIPKRAKKEQGKHFSFSISVTESSEEGLISALMTVEKFHKTIQIVLVFNFYFTTFPSFPFSPNLEIISIIIMTSLCKLISCLIFSVL